MRLRLRQSRVVVVCAMATCVLFSRSAMTGHAADSTGGLERIFGTQAATWQFKGGIGTSQPPYQLENRVGQPVLLSSKRTLTLTNPTLCKENTEIVVQFRFAMPAKQRGQLRLQAGLKKVEDLKEVGLATLISGMGGVDDVSWRLSPLPGDKGSEDGKKPPADVVGTYLIKAVKERSLAWPEWLRKRVESDTAPLPALAEKWLTLRMVLRPNAYRVYLDDRLLLERRSPDLDVTGAVRLQISPLVEVASVQTSELLPENPRFEPVAMGGYLNAARIQGKQISRASLPEPGKGFELGGVPFMFPGTDMRGNDHLDLEPSWLQMGCVDGIFEPHTKVQRGEARWFGAMCVNPARIQLRIPNARYIRLHLIAAVDGEPNSTPVVTAQFFRPKSGFPRNFAGRVPLFSARSTEAKALPVKLEGGGSGQLYLVTMPLDPGALTDFKDMDYLDVELTKEVQLYRCYPDPAFYSAHQAGLPSGVHVYALTLEKPAVNVSFEPDKYIDVWTAPAKPGYTVTLVNRTDKPRPVELALTTRSHDGEATTEEKKAITVPAGSQGTTVKLSVTPKKYGHHTVALSLKDGDDVWEEERGLAYLHEDTRERGGWDEGKGPLFGFWHWGGRHYTPGGIRTMEAMIEAGMESRTWSMYHEGVTDEERTLAEKTGFMTHWFTSGGDLYNTGKVDPAKPEESATNLVAWVRKNQTPATKINKPELMCFFAEPNIGPMTYGNVLSEYWGGPIYSMTTAEKESFAMYLAKFLIGARAIRKEWPQVKFLLPWGDCMFTVPFLRNPEARELIDGVGLDVGYFERLPEQQLHQCSLHRMWMFCEEWKKAGRPKPILAFVEGPCIGPVLPGALTEDQMADRNVRASLIVMAYGTTRLLTMGGEFASGDYWGEQHYGGGNIRRIPLLSPYVSYVAITTMTRQLNRMNFKKWIPTGSLSTYCLQFKHYKTGVRVHVLWTIRGKRPVLLDVPSGAKVEVYDQMDNAMKLTQQDGKKVVTIDSSPCYVWGLPGDAVFTLGEPDHADDQPAQGAVRLANLGDGAWQIVPEPDADYEASHAEFIRRYPGRMTANAVEVSAVQGGPASPFDYAQGYAAAGKALAVHLEKQAIERRVMPYYTTLAPRKPIEISGKASHIGIWAKAASDWGRVVYCLRDAQGERWLSVGHKDQYNNDDSYGWSVFCFDGWRYLRFELPANAPYDCYRENGSTWWGHYGPGDGIVDLPLKLERIIVERRTHAMYVNDPQPTSTNDVLLADLYAEYAKPDDKTDAVVRLSRIRMPVPVGVPEIGNPITELAGTGVGAPTVIEKITLPDQIADGTRCLVHFKPVTGAVSYDIWASPYPDGRGALALGKDWKEPGNMLIGFRPDTDFYLFVVYVDKDGKPSKPSSAFKIHLKDIFAMK